METGTIRHWNDDKGYGFLTPDENPRDIFFHVSKWRGQGRPTQGERVRYNWEQTDKNPAATEVHPLQSANQNRYPPAQEQTETNTRGKKNPLKNPLGILAMLIVACYGAYTLWRHPETPNSSHTPNATVSQQQDEQLNKTLALIKQGGPFPYPEHDGVTFGNREHQLPEKPRGYYHEYTVPTPGAKDRGARRIVTGGNPPEVYYYTTDHYKTFTTLDVQP